MRTAFVRTLEQLAAADSRINLVVGDLGFGVVEPFARAFPNQFLNAGVAEQNMTGVAAGMALCGKTVFTYSIANFPTLRCLEQIRNDVCYHNANVKIVSLGGGLGYGALGVTHHATEDVAILRALPNMTVIAPGDPVETRAATRALAAHSGPAYLRLGRAGEPDVHGREIDFEIGRAIRICDGRDVCLIASGGLLMNALRCAKILRTRGIEARLISMHTIKPLDARCVLAAAREIGAILTIEEHSTLGGLGSAVAEVLAESGEQGVVFRRLGLPPVFSSETGSQEYLWSRYSLAPDSLADSVEGVLRPIAAGG